MTTSKSENRILPATPKKSTTSYCTTGSGGITPERTDDAAKRRELQARLTAPTPTEAAANFWEAYERGWEERIRESDRREREEMQDRIRRDDQRQAELKARQEKVKRFRPNERLVSNIFDDAGLTPAERGRVNARLLAMGDIHNTDAATVFAQEEVLSRGTKPASSCDEGIDWRAAIGVKK